MGGVCMPICERCGSEHDGTFGSGRFCCRSCANARTHSEKTKRKTSETLKSKFRDQYGDGISTVRELKKFNNSLNKELVHEQCLCFVNNSCDAKILSYFDIDFGDKFAIFKNGSVMSMYTGKYIPTHERDGYVTVSLADINCTVHCLYVHRLVAYNFIPNPDNLPIINHKDCNPSNNNVDNLEWCTYQYNATYNDAHIKRGKALSEYMRSNGGNWNKGKKLKK